MLKKQDLGNTTECDKTLIKFFQIRRKHHIFQAGGQQALLHTLYQPLKKKKNLPCFRCVPNQTQINGYGQLFWGLP